MDMRRSIKIIIFLLLAAGIVAGGVFWLNGKHASRLNLEKEKLAQEIQQKIVLDELEEKTEPETSQPIDNNPPTEESAVPAKHLLAMPFYSQAPGGNWDAFHEDMCEEASLLNAGLYLENKKLSLDDYDKELLKMKSVEEKLLGEWKSNPVADIKKLSDEYFAGKIESKIIDNPTIEQIETEIAAGNPVIVPLAGRDIGNPNYRQPGPIYHMLVVKGYDEKFFITN